MCHDALECTDSLQYTIVMRTVTAYGKAFLVLAAGVGWHMSAPWLAERASDTFPTIHDVVLDQLPFVDLFGVGEVAFFVLLALFAYVHLGRQRQELPTVLTLLGIFYGLRGFFLLLLPIGAPVDAPALADRFELYPYASHAYFPGGHIGILLLMTLTVRNRSWRTFFVCTILLFGLGSMLTRSHYTADVLGGLMLGYGIWLWGRQSPWFQRFVGDDSERHS